MIVRKQRGRLTALLFVFFLSAASVAAYAADGSTAMSDMEEAGEESGRLCYGGSRPGRRKNT